MAEAVPRCFLIQAMVKVDERAQVEYDMSVQIYKRAKFTKISNITLYIVKLMWH